MPAALCLTPDAAFFPAAVCAAAHALAQDDAQAYDVFIVCEPGDVLKGYGALPAALRARINILTADFSYLNRTAPGIPGVLLRRLFLGNVLPESYSRIITFDSDMLTVRPGLGALAGMNLNGAALAAATDMIFYKQFGGGDLARQFHAYRAGLGLGARVPYFNAGLMVIDRAQWTRERWSERALDYLRANRAACAFAEQSALNALAQGQFAQLSPRCNFMGDFFLLDVLEEVRPFVLHFVKHPKPWEGAGGFDGGRFSRVYRDWFDASPWPEFGVGAHVAQKMARGVDVPDMAAFRARLLAHLAAQDFADGPLILGRA